MTQLLRHDGQSCTGHRDAPSCTGRHDVPSWSVRPSCVCGTVSVQAWTRRWSCHLSSRRCCRLTAATGWAWNCCHRSFRRCFHRRCFHRRCQSRSSRRWSWRSASAWGRGAWPWRCRTAPSPGRLRSPGLRPRRPPRRRWGLPGRSPGRGSGGVSTVVSSTAVLSLSSMTISPFVWSQHPIFFAPMRGTPASTIRSHRAAFAVSLL